MVEFTTTGLLLSLPLRATEFRFVDYGSSGEVFCEDSINPDVDTETPLEDAIAWIKKY